MRYRIEIFDELKSNDMTLYSETKIEKAHLDEMVFSNVSHFDGNVRAFVFDTKSGKKIVASFLPYETIRKLKSKLPKKMDFGLV